MNGAPARPSLVFIALAAALSGPALAQEPVRLKTVKVSAAEDTGPAKSSRAASKTDTPLKELPQAVTVVERHTLEAQGAREMKDVLRNVSGVALNQGEGRRDQFYIRGFDAARDTLIDGVRDDSQYFRELANVERVEVLKGPAAALYGRGSAGGAIHRVTKKPLAEQQSHAELSAGSDALRRAELDSTGPLTDGLRYRAIAAWEDGDSFRDVVHSNRRFFAPSLAVDLGERTELLAQVEYLDQDRTPDRGLPSVNGRPAKVPVSNFYGERYDYAHTEAENLRLRLDHRFNDRLSLSDTLSWGRTELEAMNTRHVGLSPDKRQLRRNTTYFPQEQRNLLNQTELVYRAAAGAVEHTLLAGIEVARQRFDRETRQVNVANIDLEHPRHVLTRPDPASMPIAGFTGALSRFEADTDAVYVQDQLSFSEHWKALAGTRWDRFDQAQDDKVAGLTERREDRTSSPRLGLVYLPVPSLSLYGSLARSAQPIGGDFFYNTRGNGIAFADVKPLETRLKELGLKAEALDGRLSATLAAFELEQEHRLTPSPQDPQKTIQGGNARSRGLELDLAAAPTEAWNLTASWSYTDAEITQSFDRGIPAGNRPGNIPAHQGSLWSDYRFDSGFGVGLGVFHVGARYALDDNSVRLPAYTRTDATLFYEQGRYRVNLVLNNLGDETYYESANNNVQIGPGAPFNWRLSGRVSF
ncbi:MAG: TonB-dependent siderophore receptor [Gammaproteobacteria bacterium]|nr:TonB-dependent siderophore receptor [Gammaproteobacteria bacterium]